MIKSIGLLSVFVGVLFAVPNAPSVLKLSSPSSHSVLLKWQDNSDNERGFKIFRNRALINIVPKDTRSFIDTDLKAGTQYTYIVKATDDTATLFVDQKSGNDASDGTQDAPFKTIQAAVNHAEAGNSIYIKAGTYQERVELKRSGTESAPIMIEGELDKDGHRLVYVHGGDLVQAQWKVAEEIPGGLTYKTQDIPYESYAMTINQNGVSKDIPRLYETNQNPWKYLDENLKDKVGNYTYEDVLALGKDAMVKTHYNKLDINYWDGIEAVYTYVQRTKTTYLRFKNGDNPNAMELYTAPGEHNHYGNSDVFEYAPRESATFSLENKRYITIKNLHIDGAENGILIYGPESAYNVIDNNEIINGQRRIALAQRAHHNIIQNNILHMNLLSQYRPGAWFGAGQENLSDEEKYKRAVSEHYYITYKHEIGYSRFPPVEDCGVFLNGSGNANNIHNNEVYDTLCGVAGSHKGDVYIHDNIMHHNSDIATALFKRSEDTYIYRNKFYDNNILCRIFLEMTESELEFLKKKAYIFQNVSYNPKGMGSHIYFSREGSTVAVPPNDTYDPEVFIFHNTFVGSGRDGNIVQDVDSKILIVNNIFQGVYMSTTETFNDVRTEGRFKHVSHNWFNAQSTYTNDNEVHRGDHLWDVPSIPMQMLDFSLPAQSTATGNAIDVTKAFSVDGKRYPAMPLIYNWYYRKHSPNMGAIQ